MSPSVADFIVDFSKEEDSSGGGSSIRVPEAWHRVKVIKAKPTVSAQKGTAGLEVIFAFLDGDLRRNKKRITDTLWASPKAYSRFRLLLEACGKKVPSKVNATKIGAAVQGCELFIQTEDEERDGYDPRSRVTFRGFKHVDDMDDEVAEDEELEEEDIEDEADLDEEDELEDEDEEEEEPAPKRRKAKASNGRKRAAKVVEEDEDEDEEDEDEEEEPAPRRKRAATKTKAKRKAKAKDEDDEDDDLNDLDLDEL